MDWIWPIYEERLRRQLGLAKDAPAGMELQQEFLSALGESTATLYAMVRTRVGLDFKGLGKWQLSDVPALVSDPHEFIATKYGGGKFKLNFHRVLTFIGTHNFRTYGDELWREMEEVDVDPD
jgi:hypothetical protein